MSNNTSDQQARAERAKMKLFTQLSEQGIAFQGIFIKEQGSLLRKKLYLEVYTDDDSQWENIPKSYEGFEVDTATPRD